MKIRTTMTCPLELTHDIIKGITGFTLLHLTAGNEAEFRIALHRRHVGKGMGAEATRATVQTGFDQFRLERITLIVRKNNSRAARLYDRVGFRITGESVHTVRGKRFEFIDMDITRVQFNMREHQ